ncbi:hypothetical protein BH10BAC2_BH10BAC2_44100 [soil metagenome]
MKRRPRFFIGFIAAAITFATLMAFAKPLSHERKNGSRCWYHEKQAGEATDTTKKVIN